MNVATPNWNGYGLTRRQTGTEYGLADEFVPIETGGKIAHPVRRWRFVCIFNSCRPGRMARLAPFHSVPTGTLIFG